MPTACSMENSPAKPPLTLIGTDVSTANRSSIYTSSGDLLVSVAIVWRTFSSMPPTLVPASPHTFSTCGSWPSVSMIFSAPDEISTDTVRPPPLATMEPAGMVRSFTSPAGVLITTAERLPIKARATGTIFLVSSAVKLNTVAIPYGFDN